MMRLRSPSSAPFLGVMAGALFAASCALAQDGSSQVEAFDPLALAGEAADMAEPVVPAPPVSDWNEIALPPGVFVDRTEAPAHVWRSDVIEIPVAANGGALEYKLLMNAGDVIVYRWRAEGLDDPSLLLAEFHGHTERLGDAPGDLMFYRQVVGAAEAGALTAPFSGIHGWYLENSSDSAVTVVLDVAGFYDIVEGQEGVIR